MGAMMNGRGRKPQKDSVLAKIRNAQTKLMLSSLGATTGKSDSKEFDEAFEEFAYPQRRHLVKMSDEELAELMGAEPSGSYLHHLAASVLSSRDSWRTPARWALILSAISIFVSIIALWHSLNLGR